MISPEQCRAARVLLDIAAIELAEGASVGIATIKRFESGQAVKPATVERLATYLTGAGVLFIAAGEASPGGNAGVRLV